MQRKTKLVIDHAENVGNNAKPGAAAVCMSMRRSQAVCFQPAIQGRTRHAQLLGGMVDIAAVFDDRAANHRLLHFCKMVVVEHQTVLAGIR